MNKNLYLLLLMMFYFGKLQSQIKIENTITPQIGDELKMIKSSLNDVDLETAGEDKFWNFSHLKGGILMTTQYKAPLSNDAIKSDLKAFQKKQIDYYKKSSFGLSLVASYRKDPLFHVYSLLNYVKPKLARPDYMKYNGYFNFDHQYTQYITKKDIPAEIKSFLPFVKDSIKLEVDVTMSMNFDAWGKLVLQKGHNYDVLRLKEVNTYNARLYIKSDKKWVEVEVNDVSELRKLMVNIRLTKYTFFNKLSKEPIATIHLNKANEISKVEYKDTDSALLLPKGNSGKKDVYLFPNPSFGAINAVFLNVTPGTYTLKISNILGKKIWETQYRLEENGIFKENLSYLSKGPYLYSVTGPDGERIVTRKITILKP